MGVCAQVGYHLGIRDLLANGHSVASACWSSMCRELPGAAFHPPTLLLFLLRPLERRLNVSALPAATPTEWELSLFVEHLGVPPVRRIPSPLGSVLSNPFIGMKLCACYETRTPEWVKQRVFPCFPPQLVPGSALLLEEVLGEALMSSGWRQATGFSKPPVSLALRFPGFWGKPLGYLGC